MTNTTVSSDLLRGHTDTIILKLLLGGDHYGYEISKKVYETSGHMYELNEATMYSSLKRLENDGRITAYWGSETQGVRRKYYRLTDAGKELYAANKNAWDVARTVLEKLL